MSVSVTDWLATRSWVFMTAGPEVGADAADNPCRISHNDSLVRISGHERNAPAVASVPNEVIGSAAKYSSRRHAATNQMRQLPRNYDVSAVFKILASAILVIAIMLAMAWGGFALWFRLPGSGWVRAAAAAAFFTTGMVAIAGILMRRRQIAILTFGAVLGAVLLWWSTIRPLAVADWAPDVSRQVTGRQDGDTLVLTNVRNFEWRSDTDFTERWETRTYDLSKLRTLDLFMSYWAGPQMAHVILSFGFDGGDRLAWSIEVRRQQGGEYSPVADTFKTSPLVIIAADERDVVRVRSNVRHEDVQLYRLATPPTEARRLLEEYVEDANNLAGAPQFYNSLTTNCTTAVVKMSRAAGADLPLDWRFIVNGYLPGYLYSRSVLDTELPFDEVKALSHIDDRAQAAAVSAEFSRLIRVGVPSPRRAQPE